MKDSSMKSSHQPKGPAAGQRGNIPWPFIIILAVVIIPIIAAYVAYYTGIGVSDETVNKGILLEPPVSLNTLADAATGDVPDLSEHKWRIVLPVTAPCDETCRQNLYTTRQVHIRLGEKSERVERIAVNLDPTRDENGLKAIKEGHPLLQHFTVSREDWDQWLAGTNVPDNLQQSPYYLLVDQSGYAMMYYTADHHGNELLDDIKRVLRYTPE